MGWIGLRDNLLILKNITAKGNGALLCNASMHLCRGKSCIIIGTHCFAELGSGLKLLADETSAANSTWLFSGLLTRCWDPQGLTMVWLIGTWDLGMFDEMFLSVDSNAPCRNHLNHWLLCLALSSGNVSAHQKMKLQTKTLTLRRGRQILWPGQLFRVLPGRSKVSETAHRRRKMGWTHQTAALEVYWRVLALVLQSAWSSSPKRTLK